MHGGVVTAVRRYALLQPLPPLAEGALLDAQRGDPAPHAPQPEVPVALYLYRYAIVVAVHRDGDVRPRRVPLNADEEGVRRRR